MKGRFGSCSNAGMVFMLLVLSAAGRSAFAQNYRVVDVKAGGTIHGTVKLSGGGSTDVVATGKDDKVCGAQKPLPELSVGKNGGVKDAIVYIEGIAAGKKFAPAHKLLLDQKNCEYSPHVMIIPFGSPLQIENSDPVLHNVHIYEVGSGRQSLLNIAQPIKGQRTVINASQIRKPGLLAATCDAGHPWMSAWIMVAEHPYYAVTDANGNYSITNIPPGSYKIVMWHEGVKVTKVDRENGKPTHYAFEEPYQMTSNCRVPQKGSANVDFDMHLR